MHRCALAIEPHHLLLLGDDASLADRGDIAPRQGDTGSVGAETPELLPEPGARRVAADHTADRGTAAERGDVAHHVPRAAGTHVLVGHVHHRDGRFRRDAIDPAPDELIEHEVAHDQHADTAQPAHERREPPPPHAAHGASP